MNTEGVEEEKSTLLDDHFMINRGEAATTLLVCCAT